MFTRNVNTLAQHIYKLGVEKQQQKDRLERTHGRTDMYKHKVPAGHFLGIRVIHPIMG